MTRGTTIKNFFNSIFFFRTDKTAKGPECRVKVQGLRQQTHRRTGSSNKNAGPFKKSFFQATQEGGGGVSGGILLRFATTRKASVTPPTANVCTTHPSPVSEFHLSRSSHFLKKKFTEIMENHKNSRMRRRVREKLLGLFLTVLCLCKCILMECFAHFCLSRQTMSSDSERSSADDDYSTTQQGAKASNPHMQFV